MRSALEPAVFDTLKQLGFVVIYDAEETQQVTGRAETSFDYWHGFTSRF
jgi:hypothetical protein